MSKKLRGSYSVYKETVANKGIVSTEMFIISAVIGYLASSWAVWLIAALVLFGVMGTNRFVNWVGNISNLGSLYRSGCIHTIQKH